MMLLSFLDTCSTSASSIKTRIKTGHNLAARSFLKTVRVHLPLKQGLRRLRSFHCISRYNRTSASSIKTRIKTHLTCRCARQGRSSTSASSIKTRIKTIGLCIGSMFRIIVRVHLPLKQGLRLFLGKLQRSLYVYECIFH